MAALESGTTSVQKGMTRRRFVRVGLAGGATVLFADLLTGCESAVSRLVGPEDAGPTIYSPTVSSNFGAYSSISPHWSHISMRHTSFGGTPSSSDLDWLAAHYDCIMSDARTPYTSRNSSIIHGPYCLHWAPLVPGMADPDSIQSVYVNDATNWANTHGKNIEDFFCHYQNGQLKLGGTSGVGPYGDGTKTLANRLQISIWGSNRYVINPGNADQRQYQIDRISRCFAIYGDEYLFFDEHATGDMSNARVVSLEYASSSAYQSDIIAQLQALRASLSPSTRYFVINTASYIKANDQAMVSAAGGAHMENITFYGAGNTTEAWTVIDTLSGDNHIEIIGGTSYNSSNQVSGLPSNMTAGNYTSAGARAKIGEYCMALMAVPADPSKYFWDGANSQWTLSPQSARWFGLYEFDIGHPDAARVEMTGLSADPAGQSTHVSYRLFGGGTYCVILRRNNSTPGSQYGDNSAVTVSLPSPAIGTSWKMVHEDGTIDTVDRTSITLRLWEGAVLVSSASLALVSDTFTRADNATSLGSPETGPSGMAWVVAGSPVWGVTSGSAYRSSGSGFGIATVDSGISDCDVSADVMWGVYTETPGVAFRSDGTKNNLWRAYLDTSGIKLFLGLTINGTAYIIANGNYSFSPGSTYTLRVVATGTSIKCYVNGTLVISFNDNRFTANTKHGICMTASGASSSRIDNFTVKTP